VKCDERRPACSRCCRYGHTCAGYDDLFDLTSKPVLILHKLLPRSHDNSLALSSSVPLHLPKGISFQDERERQYFHLFQDYISTELSAGFEATLWSRTVLQACENESIRQLTIATAALKQSIRSWKGPNEMPQTDRAYALQEYGRALKGLRAAVGSSQSNLRIALIAALLIFVFESMYGDAKAAVANIQSALDLINNRLRWQDHSPSNKHGTFPSHFSDQVEDDLLKPFIRLDRPAVALLGRSQGFRPKQNRFFSYQRFLEDYRMPSSFGTISEARQYYECIRFRAFPEHNWEMKLSDSTSLPEGVSAPAILLLEMFSETAAPECVPGICLQLEQWHRAFLPLLQLSRSPEGASIYIAATTLYIQALSLRIPLDQAAPNFNVLGSNHSMKHILELQRTLVRHPDFSKSFVFDSGIIPTVWMVFVLCPDVVLKKEALEILREMQPRVECVWDSRVIAQTGEMFLEKIEKQSSTASFSARELGGLTCEEFGEVVNKKTPYGNLISS
jgi:hypothetical protein